MMQFVSKVRVRLRLLGPAASFPSLVTKILSSARSSSKSSRRSCRQGPNIAVPRSGASAGQEKPRSRLNMHTVDATTPPALSSGSMPITRRRSRKTIRYAPGNSA
ncbi:hypothetical protein FOVG_01433 [Fusarium oxysporum f. sp. pisi HDV247]|uniref:Uncharacterized protein n=1 Tax=Fusarium oxysporum f. sp. pisi HDV247 TaxID=1080344 RepID=W9QEZ1_FUSOX|nr:hypothetical protein FOVG_01433 [Fusarium oxysporum f. sp. pisi HDV247]